MQAVGNQAQATGGNANAQILAIEQFEVKQAVVGSNEAIWHPLRNHCIDPNDLPGFLVDKLYDWVPVHDPMLQGPDAVEKSKKGKKKTDETQQCIGIEKMPADKKTERQQAHIK